MSKKLENLSDLNKKDADHEEDTLDNIYERRGMTLVSVLFV
jgi:hypothetical protein